MMNRAIFTKRQKSMNEYRLKVHTDGAYTVYPAWLYNELRKNNIQYTADNGFLVFTSESDFKRVSTLFNSGPDSLYVPAKKPLKTAKNASFANLKKSRKLF